MEVGPDKLRFVYSHHGKPLLDVNTNPEPLNFNLSHSGDFVLYTFTRSRNIGIDIELVRENVALEQIALRFFSPDEIISLENINKEKRPELFFQYWTRKEAFLKAKGEGVSFPMELCDVSQLNGTQLSPIKILGDNSKDSYWFGRDLIAAPGYVGAIAVEGDKVNLSCRDYSVEEM